MYPGGAENHPRQTGQHNARPDWHSHQGIYYCSLFYFLPDSLILGSMAGITDINQEIRKHKGNYKNCRKRNNRWTLSANCRLVEHIANPGTLNSLQL